MKEHIVNKSFKEINAKIKAGEVVVVTAEEIIEIVRKEGPVKAAQKVDVVTTGTFAPMCSSGAVINFGQSGPPIRASKVWLNNVPAYGGVAAADCFLGATEVMEGDPLNKVHPGEFNYGGGHVLEDLLLGKKVNLRAESYGTDCYPRREAERTVTLKTLPQVTLCNPRNGYQNYNCAINLTDSTKYTYMGVLKPKAGNATYCSAGQLSPLLNDPYYMTIGLGTRIFLGGGEGYITWHGTQHNPNAERGANGVPLGGAGTLWLMGDLKQMSADWVRGLSILGYGVSLAVGVGVPIPLLNEEISAFTAIADEDILAPVVDYGDDYPQGKAKPLAHVSYAKLRSGEIEFRGKKIPTVPLSSMAKAREIAEILKGRIKDGKFFLGEPQMPLPGKP